MEYTKTVFMDGMKELKGIYVYWKVDIKDPQLMGKWYKTFKKVFDGDAFLPLIILYCQTEPAPTCPSDLINFARKKMVNSALSPERFVQAFIEALKNMQKDDFIYSDPSIEEEKQYVTLNVFLRYPESRIDYSNEAITDAVDEYLQSLWSALSSYNSTTVSIVSSEIKSKYSEKLFEAACRTPITLDIVKQLESSISVNKPSGAFEAVNKMTSLPSNNEILKTGGI